MPSVKYKSADGTWLPIAGKSGVEAFNGRAGAVKPAFGDYTAEMVGAAVNPNLLHNWYFVNPVNQRGQTEYSGSAYGIDRWKMGSANLKVEGDGISLAWTGASGSTNGYIQQFLEQDYFGREVTVSVLLDSGLYSMTETLKAGGTDRYTLNIDGGNLQLNYGVYSTRNSVLLRNYTTTPVKVIAMKAELGSTQTLAHQDADGNWVLNEIPNYNEELLKCCMSTTDPSGADEYANNKKTPVAIGALSTGGGTLSGKLKIVPATVAGSIGSTVDDNSFRIDGGTRYDKGAYITLWGKDAWTAGRFEVAANDGSASSVLIGTSAGGLQWAGNTILHTGNKPQGSECFYFGNGGLTRDPINTGGIGRAIMVYCNSGFAIVTPLGAIVATNGTITHLGSDEATFYEGTLTLHTQNGILNGSANTQHFYQVL